MQRLLGLNLWKKNKLAVFNSFALILSWFPLIFFFFINT